MAMIISNSNPIQWWLVGQPTFNEKIEDGVDHIDYCQPWNNSDTIKDQFQSDTGKVYYLRLFDINDVELAMLPYSEVLEGVYQLSFVPEDEGITNKWVRGERVAGIIDEFVSQVSAADNDWEDIAYGNGLFVAVSNSGAGNRIMTSPDGENWTVRVTSVDYSWTSIAFGNGRFVVVGVAGTTVDAVMYSDDGITWLFTDAPAVRTYTAITYGNGLFVVVAASGVGNRVMTSPDGIVWTERATPADNFWVDVIYGNGLFVAIASSGVGNRVMTSPDGIVWTIRVSAADSTWTSIAYGNGIYAVVGSTGTFLMTSGDGITWVSGVVPADKSWKSVVFGGGRFVAIGETGAGQRAMTSTDGESWVLLTTSANNDWRAITYGDDIFVAVSRTGVGNRVMTLSIELIVEANSHPLNIRTSHKNTRLWLYSNKQDYDNLVYFGITPVPNFNVRVECKFYTPRRPEENQSEKLTTGQVVKLLGTLVEQKKIYVMPVPPYMNLKYKNILQHNTVYINNERWLKEEEYKDDEVLHENYPFFPGETYLTKQDDSYTTNPFGE